MAGGSMSAWMEAWESDLTPSPAARRSAARVEARTRASRYYGREATARLPEPVPHVERTRIIQALRVVRHRKPRWGVVIVALLFALVLVGTSVVVPAMVKSATTEIEATLGVVEVQQKELSASTSAIAAQISTLASPLKVVEQAAELGLVPATEVSYVAAATQGETTEGHTQVAGR